MGNNTKVEYIYRDASNYKVYGEEVIQGRITDKQKEIIRDSLSEGLYFIPFYVGLKPLDFGDELSEDDHPWHELDVDSLKETDEKPTLEMTAPQFVQSFRDVEDFGGWDETFY